MDRRTAIKSMIALAVAPAIVKIDMIMPVKTIVRPGYETIYPVYVLLTNNMIRGDNRLMGVEETISIKWLTLDQIKKLYSQNLGGYEHLILGDSKEVRKIVPEVGFKKQYRV